MIEQPAITDGEFCGLIWFAAKAALDSPTWGLPFFRRMLLRHTHRLDWAACHSLLWLLAAQAADPRWLKVFTALRARQSDLEPTAHKQRRPRRAAEGLNRDPDPRPPGTCPSTRR